ncbi:pantetheine-phosphate adenylyltransferase [uncultured Brachyspira sp.]|uniref:pantetheine-phosphate adenylyltransferase n=1 Tax=uncultured Brachyspira sp. TaxID=221953 RepID=UPI0026065F03|nr:pantetheine-phosphate adenylyltransferase [uncultured Brachyspira sp.]
MKNGKVIFPGTFDPFTLGHLDVLYRLADIFEKVYISVAVNLEKSPTFTVEERKNMIKKVIGENEAIEIVSISGLVTNYMKENNIKVLARGIRDSEDLYYELKMARMNKLLYPEMDTIFLHTSENYAYVSSSLIKEVLKFNGPIDGLVPEILIDEIKSKFIK